MVGPLIWLSGYVRIGTVHPNSPPGYEPAFGPLVIENESFRSLNGEKSSSVPMIQRLFRVNSAWWALPSGNM